MWNFFLILCALLLVEGVSVDETIKVSVIEGDSVTLKPDDGEIQTTDTTMWKFNGLIIKFDDALERFKLNDQSRSLTIKNIRTTDSGLYELNIKKDAQEIPKIYSVTVSDGVKSVSVTEGDTVTLHTGVSQKQSNDVIQWKFGDQDLNGPDDKSWRNIDLNKETGDLTISNIRGDQTGDYKLEFNTRRLILHRTLIITVSGEMNTVSVMEGEPIILYTGLIKIEGHDLILWKFGDHLVAEINKETNRLLPHDSSDGGRFKGRLQLDRESGSLTVRGSRSTDSGVYHLDMSSSSYSLQRNISVTVSAPDKPTPDPGLSSAPDKPTPDPGLSSDKPAPVSGLSSGAVAWIVVGLLLLVIVAGVIYHCHKITELERRMDVEKNGTNVPLNAETANSDALQSL